MTTRVSVVVPLYNEEEGLPLLVDKLTTLRQRLAPQCELECVLVDDGSQDGTLEKLRQYFNGTPNVITVAHGRNRGLGAALRSGFQHASGEVIATIDADCTFDPLILPSLLEAMERENADIAIGSPYHPQGGVENVVPWRLFLSRGASRLYRMVCPAKLFSYTSLMRAYRRRVLERVTPESNGFDGVTELLLRALFAGYRAVEIPTVLRRRASGVSKMNIARTIKAHLRLASRALLWRFRRPSAAVLARSSKQS